MTKYEAMSSIVERFADAHNLRWSFINDEKSRTYTITLQNHERSWGYQRQLSYEQLFLYSGGAGECVQCHLDDMLRKIQERVRP